MIVGLFLTYVLGLALEPLLISYKLPIRDPLKFVLGMVLCYTCISLLMQTRNDFRFIIPYVEFAKEVKGVRPCVLDTSVIIDGRIADVAETNIIDGKLIIPKFVITELQAIADSSDRLRRGRGRRGLDILNRLRTAHAQDLEIFEQELPEFANQPVDIKLVILAKHLQGKLITNDYNLNKVAKLQGVPVINFNDLSNALEARLPARRTYRRPRRQGRRRAGPRRGLSRRRHDGRHRKRPRPHQRHRQYRRHQRAANQRGTDGVREGLMKRG